MGGIMEWVNVDLGPKGGEVVIGEEACGETMGGTLMSVLLFEGI